MDFINIDTYKNFGGVYKISNTKTQEYYIGSCSSFDARFRQHLTCLNRNDHANYKLQKSWNMHGPSNFTFEVLETCTSREDAFEKEQSYLKEDLLLLNICKVVKSTLTFGKSVCKYSSEGKLLKIYSSLSDAALDECISVASISAVLNGKSKSAGSYIWKEYDSSSEILNKINTCKHNYSHKSYWRKYLLDTKCKIYKFNTLGVLLREYEDIDTLLKEETIDKHLIYLHLSGKRNQLNGYVFSVNRNCFNELKLTKNKPIIQFNDNKEILAKYKSLEEAAKALGKNSSSIRDAVTRRKGYSKAYGYHWQYDDGSELVTISKS